MSTEENKALSNKGAEAIGRAVDTGDFDALDEIYAP